MLALGQAEAGFGATAIEAALPVAISLELPNTQVLRKILTSQPFEGKVMSRWMLELEAGDRDRIMDQIRIGLVQGESSTQIGRRVFGSTALQFGDGSRRATERGLQSIVNTATNFITNEARQELYLANKQFIPFEVYQATLDSRTTAICRALDGTKHDVGKGPTPPLHFNCRSVRVPAINGRLIGNRPATGVSKSMVDGLRGEERRRVVDGLVGQVPATQNYQTFLRNQTVDFQNDVMGVTKARLFRKGGLTLDRFVTEAGKELTIKDLRDKFPQAFIRAGLE